MSNTILIVPVQVDALFVPSERMVVEETADFSRLPYVTPKVDVQPNNPYISEEIVSKPFQNTTLHLDKGIHLHWSLPDALTRGWQEEIDGAITTSFPTVPNRWLVRKFKAEKLTSEWVVLSDYLHPDGTGEGNVCIPYAPDPDNSHFRPFRFLGKVLTLDEYLLDLEEGRSYPSYPDLTVHGYGEPTFAAFYPNCHSVFGFHDHLLGNDKPTASDLHDLSYEVIGWYSDKGNDFLSKRLAEISKAEEQWSFIENTLKWSVPSGLDPEKIPSEMRCYAKIVFDPKVDTLNTGVTKEPTAIAVGITGTEALSAFLGQSLSSDIGGDKSTGDEEKRMIENQLEALLIGADNGGQLAIGPRFRQLRHEKGFIAEDGGNYWVIQKAGDQIINAALLDTTWTNYQDLKAKVDEFDFSWDTLRDCLSDVNKDHLDYDNVTFTIEAKKQQLFADWYKYMVCAYPPENAWDSMLDMDDVRYFIEKSGLIPLTEQENRIGKLTIDLKTFNASENSSSTQADKLAIKINVLVSQVERHNSHLSELVAAINQNLNTSAEQQGKQLQEQEKISAPVFTLSQKPRPRFWKPKDPVILAVGPALKASNRYGSDGRNDPAGRLSCALLADDRTIKQIIENKALPVLSALINDMPSALNIWTEQPWNPLKLEWRIQLFPVVNKSNMAETVMDFDPSFITNNFKMQENDPDVSYLSTGKVHVPSASIYSGSAILTRNASKHLLETLKAYIEKNVLQECLANKEGKGYFEAKGIADEVILFNWPEKIKIEDVNFWYESIRFGAVVTTTESEKNKDLSFITIKAFMELTKKDFHSLSQALGGFNESLLMHKETLQLKIKDPLAFPEYGEFTDDIANAVGNVSCRAPLPQNDFNPLRAGKLSITDLRIVDSFGQYLDLDLDKTKLITSEYLEAPDNEQQVLLRPRFLQAAQVHFRWLASQTQLSGLESNDMKLNNPICGWVMANNLDNSLMIFNADGKALGAFTESDKDWKPAPGSNEGFQLDSLLDKWEETPPAWINSHLYKMLFFIKQRMEEEDNTFLTHFRLAINSAIDTIQPDTFAQHNSLAQLMGRPIALVRASLDLVLKAPPAIHQGWIAFKQDMNGVQRETNEFAKVQFPIRIGENGQLNDGVVGYWVESANGNYVDDKFYSPAANVIESPHIITHADEGEGEDLNSDSHEGHIQVNQFQTLDDDPMTVSLLFDPRGKVNLSTGLLPVKTLDIPPKLYMEAMDRMEVFFVSSPHLTNNTLNEPDHPFPLRLDLPKAPGYEWSFVCKEAQEWVEKPVLPGITAETLFSGEKRITEGWLKLRRSKTDLT